MSEPLLIGITSHRNLVADEVPLLREAVREFLLALRMQCPTLELTVLSALAAGGDQLVAEEALALGARVVAVLPLAHADYARDFGAGAERDAFEALCARATVIEMPMLDADEGGRVDDVQARARHYAQAGVYIASHSHVLLALWDGRSTGLTGGTADVVAYHLDGIKPVALERRRDQAALNPFGVGNERVAYHVVCSRAQADGAPLPPLRPLQTWWRSGDAAAAGLDAMPGELRHTLERLVAWNGDVARHAGAIGAAARGVAPESPAPASSSSPIERRFAAADWLALHYQRRVLLAMRLLYTLAACMGIAFIVYDQLAQDSMIFVFLALFALGVSIDAVARRRSWHRRYLDYRALAEGLRVQAYWRRAGLAVNGDAEFAHDDFLQKQDVELDWIRNVMRSAAVEAATQPAPRVDLERAIEDWVGHDRGGGQLGYYARRSVERARRHRLTEGLGAASLWVGVGICVVLALTVFVLPKDWKTLLVAAMGAFSIIAAVREAYAYRKADKELIKQYRYMQRIFAQARRALDRADTPQHKRRVLRALGEAALAEHAEWTLMHRGRPLERARI